MNFLKIFSEGFQDNWDSPAVTDLAGGLTLSYAGLASRMQRIHMLLAGFDMSVGSRVAVIGSNSVNWVTAYAGAITFGAAVVTMPPSYTGNVMLEMLGQVNTEILFVDPDLLGEAPDYSLAPNLKLVISMDTSRVLARRPGAVANAQQVLDTVDIEFVNMFPFGFMRSDAKAPVLSPDAVSAIFFTSGTLGSPRPVMLMADNLEGNIIYGIKASLHPCNSTAVTSTTLGTVWGTIFEVLVPLVSGAHLHVITDVRNPESLARAFEAVHPSCVMFSSLVMSKFYEYACKVNSQGTLAHWLKRLPGGNRLLDRKLGRTLKRLLGGNCREVLVGNTALSEELTYKLKQCGVPLTVVYGLTECGGLVGYAPHATYKPGTMGRTINSLVKCRIRPFDIPGFPDGAGILEVRGMTVMKGYAGDPKATESVMTDDGWMSTGDLATLSPEGDITILGRVESLIRLSRGVVAPERVEILLYGKAAVGQAIVVNRNDRLTAIIYPDYESIERFYPGANPEDVIANVVAEVNHLLSLNDHIDDVEISHEPLQLTSKCTVARYLYF